MANGVGSWLSSWWFGEQKITKCEEAVQACDRAKEHLQEMGDRFFATQDRMHNACTRIAEFERRYSLAVKKKEEMTDYVHENGLNSYADAAFLSYLNYPDKGLEVEFFSCMRPPRSQQEALDRIEEIFLREHTRYFQALHDCNLYKRQFIEAQYYAERAKRQQQTAQVERIATCAKSEETLRRDSDG